MTERARFMARQPGFISACTAASTAVASSSIQWQSRDLLRSAHKSSEFRKEGREYLRFSGLPRMAKKLNL
jgi:hypothetical protein